MSADRVVLAGAGHAFSPADCGPYLKNPKGRKFMGAQDCLAVQAAGRALEAAGLAGRPLGERAGLFLAVGYIPFELGDIERLLEASVDERGFSMRRFSTEGLLSVNPLLTFRCLSNMPAFHISVNFDVQGPYFVTYPGPGQFYLALEQARQALAAGRVDVALVAASAHQRNFLVEHHFERCAHPVPAALLHDAAGCLVLELAAAAAARSGRARGELLDCSVEYRPFDPFAGAPEPSESFEGAPCGEEALGPASLPVALSRAGPGLVRHRLESRDGVSASSAWRLA